MGVEGLQELLEGLKRTLAAYEEQEREVRVQLERMVQGRLMQAGAVQGVEMAIESLTRHLPEGEEKGRENESSGAGR